MRKCQAVPPRAPHRSIFKFCQFFIIAAFLLFQSTAGYSAVNEQDMISALLLQHSFSQAELLEMDVNSDGSLDVSDIVTFLINNNRAASLLGRHTGIMFRDQAVLFEGHGLSSGQLPFLLSVDALDPLHGVIDNRQPDDQFPETWDGHASLYFPEGLLPVSFTNEAGYDLSFEVVFETLLVSVSPTTPLIRTIIFDGNYTDKSSLVLEGTYVESITGFQDWHGANIPITFTGKFLLIINHIPADPSD